MVIFISLLRIVAVLFNCIMVSIGYAFCKRNGIPVWIGILPFAFFFGSQTLLALMPIRKIHKSRKITFVLVSITGLLPIGYFVRILIGIINSEFDFSTDPTMLFILPTVCLLFSLSPLLLFLEYRRYKHKA